MSQYSIRKAGEGDVEALAYLHTMGHKASHVGSARDAYIDAITVDENIENWTRWFKKGEADDVYIAEDSDGKPYGYVWFGPLKTPPPGMSPIRPLYTREIYGLYTLESSWGSGLGAQLMVFAFETMKQQKHSSVCLWVLKNNKRANAFYQKMGGERCGKMKSTRGEANVVESCFGWRKIP